jgi:uncharacterized protein YyaL (SSP411 family)
MSATPSDAKARRENRLARETSPYLLQHKTNPVDWWPWGPQALAEAKRTGKPILLSIGYAACHWCHVMAHESFEDDRVAAVMNELFVNIKVDREERPDIDQIYMTALHLLGEQGGWPLTMFLTSDGEPFWGGTYFPKNANYGRPGFVDLMKEVARLYRDEPERINHNRTGLMDALTAAKTKPAGQVSVGAAELDGAAAAIGRSFDHTNGGLGRAPKFPQCSILEMLWRTGLRRGDRRFFDLVELTLEHICEGGIYDHLGGGFSRYSVDEKWLVPHFEKMLYDNAQLLELLALGFQRSGKTLFLQRAQETVGWLTREMTTPEGGFAASLDADSEGHEGKFYVWTRGEVDAALGPDDGAYFADHYDVTAGGNFEGKNILNRLRFLQRPNGDAIQFDIALQHDLAPEEPRLATLRQKLLDVREHRVRPGLDDKVLADWNGLMIAALANAGAALGQPAWLGVAWKAFAFVEQHMTRDDRLGHSWRDSKLLYPGLASDHAAMIKAALALHEATGSSDYLDRAVHWQQALDRHYARPDGGYYLTADDAEGLIVRPDATIDEATPNPNGVAAQNLVRLAALTGDDHWRQRTDALFDGLLPGAAQSLYLHASLANALDLRLRVVDVVAVGPQADQFATAVDLPFTDRIVIRAARPDDLPPGHPGKSVSLADGQTVALVCAGQRCSLPVTDPRELAAVVAAMRGGAGA